MTVTVSESISNLVATMAKNNAFPDEKAREDLMDTIQNNAENHSCFRCDSASFFCGWKRGWQIEIAGCKKMLPFDRKDEDGYTRNPPFFCSEENQAGGLSTAGFDNDNDNGSHAQARQAGEAALDKLSGRERPRG